MVALSESLTGLARRVKRPPKRRASALFMPFKPNAARRHHLPNMRRMVAKWPSCNTGLRRRSFAGTVRGSGFLMTAEIPAGFWQERRAKGLLPPKRRFRKRRHEIPPSTDRTDRDATRRDTTNFVANFVARFMAEREWSRSAAHHERDEDAPVPASVLWWGACCPSSVVVEAAFSDPISAAAARTP